MDGETLQAIKGRDQLLAMRDEWREQLASKVSEMRERIQAMEDGGNRHHRRKARAAFAKLETLERQYQRQMDAMFSRLTVGFDFDACTFQAVQDETAAKLAEIFH